MFRNFIKIVIKFSFFLFIFLQLTQDILSMENGDLDSDTFLKHKKANKANFSNKKVKVDSYVRVLQPAKQKKLSTLEYDSPQDVGAPIAGLEAEIASSSQKKRQRPVFSSSEEESVENEEFESRTIFSVLEEKEAYEVQILNAALYKPEITSTDVDLKFFTPTKLSGYREAGGTTPDLKRKIRVLKTLYPKEIKDIEGFPREDNKVFSPSVRNLPREVVGELRALEFVYHLPDYATAEPIVVETEEERAARKERQEKEFEASEAVLGNFPKQLISEREAALKPWVPFFNYVAMKKSDYLKGIGEKMRWPELGGAFMQYVAPHMEFLEIEDFEVYLSPGLINFKRINPKNGQTDAENMREGIGPTGVDGKPIHLHHALRICARSHPMKVTESMKKNRESPYKLVYVPEFIHTEYTEFLHPVNYVAPRVEINRSAFGHSREIIHQTVVKVKNVK